MLLALVRKHSPPFLTILALVASVKVYAKETPKLKAGISVDVSKRIAPLDAMLQPGNYFDKQFAETQLKEYTQGKVGWVKTKSVPPLLW
jgi:hypothetical protein